MSAFYLLISYVLVTIQTPKPTLKSNIIYARSITLRFKYVPDSIL